MVHFSLPRSDIGTDLVRLSVLGFGFGYSNIRPKYHPKSIRNGIRYICVLKYLLKNVL
ncbi:hypothetical protein RHMOL_Rhmol06G0064800 [Rhododendron molle]|uniref:Uncharacterized protein n=1 Tax=Rhododendron molle TaxID=49168 RepID=A0ACC0N9S3_RHOML|nr:hypothetical protein RHMOL_Rhmol06G0064800 [Rhododendron molle]